MSFVPKNLVFDTSTLLSACIYPDRAPSRIYLEAAKQHRLFVSEATKAEIEQVFRRRKFDKWRSLEERLNWLIEYFSIVQTVEPSVQISACVDPKDNKFLELAYASDAALIVSSDPHLLDLHPFDFAGKQIEILRLGDFEARYLHGDIERALRFLKREGGLPPVEGDQIL